MNILNMIKYLIINSKSNKIVMDGLNMIEDLIINSESIDLISANFNGSADVIYNVKLVNRYKIYRFSDKYVVEHKLNTNLFFSINKSDKVCGINHFLLQEGLLDIYICKNTTDVMSVKQVLPYFSDLLKFMTNAKGSAIFIYKNGIVFSADKHVNLREVLNELNKIIPVIKVEKKPKRQIDISTPIELKSVLDLAYEYGISDDCERDEKLKSLNCDQKKMIISIVEPQIDLINKYLDSFGDRAMPEDALMIGDVAQFYDELRME